MGKRADISRSWLKIYRSIRQYDSLDHLVLRAVIKKNKINNRGQADWKNTIRRCKTIWFSYQNFVLSFATTEWCAIIFIFYFFLLQTLPAFFCTRSFFHASFSQVYNWVYHRWDSLYTGRCRYIEEKKNSISILIALNKRVLKDRYCKTYSSRFFKQWIRMRFFLSRLTAGYVGSGILIFYILIPFFWKILIRECGSQWRKCKRNEQPFHKGDSIEQIFDGQFQSMGCVRRPMWPTFINRETEFVHVLQIDTS